MVDIEEHINNVITVNLLLAHPVDRIMPNFNNVSTYIEIKAEYLFIYNIFFNKH